MDLNILFEDTTKKVFTDVKLIIIGQDDEVVNFHCHKFVLASSSKYFYNLFTTLSTLSTLSTFDYKNKSEFKIYVDDAKVSHDMILTFYGKKVNSTTYPDYLYHIKMHICRDYFMLKSDYSLLYDMIIPADGINILLNFVELFNLYNDTKLILTIKQNIPQDYDLSDMSKNIICALLKTKDHYIASYSRTTSNIMKSVYNLHNVFGVWDEHRDDIIHMEISTDSKFIIMGYAFSNIKLYNLQTNQLVKNFGGDKSSIKFSTDSCKIAFAWCNGCIEIYDIQTDSFIQKMGNEERTIIIMAFSPDNYKLASLHNGGDHIKIWTISTGKSITINTKGAQNMLFCRGFKIISSHSGTSIKIWNTITGNIINTINVGSMPSSMALSRDNLKLVMGNHFGYVSIFDINSGKHMLTYGSNMNEECSFSSIIFIKFISKDSKIVAVDDRNFRKIMNVATGDPPYYPVSNKKNISKAIMFTNKNLDKKLKEQIKKIHK